MNGLKKKYYIIYIFLGYFAVSMIIQRSFVAEFPHHIHAWAHCDHYAISKGFVNNGFDFMHPETFVYNKQFANEDGSSNNTKVTAVDFPINNYIVAILMKVFNSDAPAIFRLYTLIVACIGLSFLFLLSIHFTKNWIVSFCIPIIIVFTPVYLDYQVGFLPSISSLTLLFLSCYYFLKYITLQKTKYLVIVVSALSIAALIRTPFIIHLIALLGFLFFDQISKRKLNFKEWLITLSGFLLPVLYFLYNGYLREKYGSIFLSSPVIIEDWAHAKEIISKAKETWKDHYFNEFQYYILSFAVIAATAKLFLSKYFLSKEGKALLRWFLIGFIGVLAYSILMIPQFKDHDYYFLDTFYPILFVLLVYATSSIKYNQYSKKLSKISMVLLAILILASSNSSLKGRRTQNPSDLYLNQYNSYLEMNELLSANKIPKNEKLLIIDSYAPNMSFILSNTSGYSLIYRSKDHIINAFDLDFKHVLVSKTYFINVLLKDFPDFAKEVELVGKTDKLLLFKKNKNEDEFSLFSFLELSKPAIRFTALDKDCADACLDENSISNIEEKEFNLAFKHVFDNSQSTFIVRVTGDIKANNDISSAFIFNLEEEGESIFYESKELKTLTLQPSEFSKFDFYFYVDKVKDKSTGSFYIYNPNKDSLKIKNYKIELY